MPLDAQFDFMDNSELRKYGGTGGGCSLQCGLGFADLSGLSLPPSSWHQDDTYSQLHEYLSDMQVVNDPKE